MRFYYTKIWIAIKMQNLNLKIDYNKNNPVPYEVWNRIGNFNKAS
jgi:hypothetical protein